MLFVLIIMLLFIFAERLHSTHKLNIPAVKANIFPQKRISRVFREGEIACRTTFQKGQFHGILLFFKLNTYLKLCFLISLISDTQTSFQLSLTAQNQAYFHLQVLTRAIKGGKKNDDQQEIALSVQISTLTTLSVTKYEILLRLSSFRIKS